MALSPVAGLCCVSADARAAGDVSRGTHRVIAPPPKKSRYPLYMVTRHAKYVLRSAVGGGAEDKRAVNAFPGNAVGGVGLLLRG